jgi:hypothetical protein
MQKQPFGKNGSFECGDRPLEITKAHMKTGRLFLTVSWHNRPTGDTKPEDTIYTNTEIKKLCPLLLCEFYEKILKVRKVHEESNNEFMTASDF